ncbi:MAG: NAD(P)H-hydrate dehydratase [Alphaproteobacteria bacterium]
MVYIENSPALWLPYFPWPQAHYHKYDRGHAVILGGDFGYTGAAILAAKSALRSGAGLVSIACTPSTASIYATAAYAAILSKIFTHGDDFQKTITDSRVKAVLLGPGAGITPQTRDFVLQSLSLRKNTILDADALTLFQETPQQLFSAIQSPVILTPHGGEYARIFGQIPPQEAATRSKAVMVLKGNQTIIASPDGRLAINDSASPFLASAGTGDVLAGICTGLVAQEMPVFEAACAAVWIHSAAAKKYGAGLIADDLPELIPVILHELFSASGGQQSVQPLKS